MIDPLAWPVHEAMAYPHIVEAIGVALSALGLAAINALPPTLPRTKDEWYAYFRDTLQSAVPMRFSPHPTNQNPAKG